jgi:glycosyltransferase involved in cell wall biosynthesis
MKILHLATSLNGGAGIAARRIVDAQVASGMDSKLLGANGTSGNLKDHEIILQKSHLKKLESKTITFAQTNFVQKGDLLVTPVTISTISAGEDLIDSSDIVHIHSFYNMLNLKDIAKLSNKKKVYVTLHDERFYTGGCHYTCGCDGFLSGCNNCPQAKSLSRMFPRMSINSALEVWSNAQGVTFVAPSRWLVHKAQTSPLIGKSKIKFIPNPVPPEFFVSKNIANYSAESHPSSLTVGFISENLNNPYKGIEILRSALAHVADKKMINLKLFGSGLPGEFPPNTSVETRKFGNSNQAQKSISECDLVIVPSTQDNSPSVIAESLMCGVPVLGSRVGGITETLQEFGLPSFASENVLELAEQIIQFTPLKLSGEVVTRISKKYAYESSAGEHRLLYEK